MSKRRSVSNKQSEEQVVCINVKGLDTLCGRGSDSSVDSEGSNDEDYEEGGDGANCDECGASFTIIASPCSKHDKVGKGGGGGGGFRPPSPYYQPPPPGYPPRYPPQQGQYGGGPPRGPPMGGPMYGGPQQQMYGPRPGGPPPPQHVHNHGPPPQQQQPGGGSCPMQAGMNGGQCGGMGGGGGGGPCQAGAQQRGPCGAQGGAPQQQGACGGGGGAPAQACSTAPGASESANPTRHYSVNVTACNMGLEKMEAKFEKKKSLVEICCNFLLKTNEDKYNEDIDNICKTLKAETDKCIQNCPPEEKGCFQTTMLMNSAAATELRKRGGSCTVPGWVKQG